MKIIIVGATGEIGKAIVKILSPRHTLISVGKTQGDVQVDVTDVNSIAKMYEHIGNFDALISATGKVNFKSLSTMQAADFQLGLNNKLMGQVNLVLQGLPFINQGGSFTLTSGILNHDPIKLGSSAAMVNGAIDGFVKSAAIEMLNNIRINAVSPTVLLESMPKYADFFSGFMPVPANQVALAFQKSVEGAQTGQIYRVGY